LTSTKCKRSYTDLHSYLYSCTCPGLSMAMISSEIANFVHGNPFLYSSMADSRNPD